MSPRDEQRASAGIRAIEFFGCAGGMAEGFRRAGVDFCASFDADPDACASYAQNLRQRPIRMDLRELQRLIDLGIATGTFDLIVADPPCTPWSRAGNRLGLEDERDMLAVTARFLGAWRPKSWLIGNVRGLDDAPNASVLQEILGPLTRHYCIDYASLDAAAYGVPQHRVRPFWFGHAWGTPCIRWPVPTHGACRRQLQIAGTELEPYVTVRQALAHLSEGELGKPIRVATARTRCGHPVSEVDRPAMTILAGQPNNCGNVLSIAYGRGDHRPSAPDEPSRTLTRNTHSDGALLLHPAHPINGSDAPSYAIACKGDGRGAQGACVISWPWDVPSTTIVCRDRASQPGRNGRVLPQSANAIKLSERAAAILQGFPENWHFAGRTKRARWSQIGQAMPPPLAHAVATAITAWFGGERQVRLAAGAETY